MGVYDVDNCCSCFTAFEEGPRSLILEESKTVRRMEESLDLAKPHQPCEGVAVFQYRGESLVLLSTGFAREA